MLVYAIPEKVLNPGFETAGAGAPDFFASWTEVAGDGAIADEGALVHSGAHAAKLTAGATANTELWQNFTVTPGLTYRLSFWTRGDGTNGGRYRVYDVTHAADIISSTSTGVTGAVYTLVAVPFTAPAGCVTVRVYLRCPLLNGGICYFDDVSVAGIALSLINNAGFSIDLEGWAPKVARSTPGRIPAYLSEEFAVQLRGTSHDNMAATMQALHEMAEYAARYWNDRTDQTPVWLHVKMKNETAERRALVKSIQGEFLSSWLGDWADDKKLDQTVIIERHPYWEALTSLDMAAAAPVSGAAVVFDYTAAPGADIVGDVGARVNELVIGLNPADGATVIERLWVGLRGTRYGAPALFVPIWECEDGTLGTDAALAVDATASPGGAGNTKVTITPGTATWAKRLTITMNDAIALADLSDNFGRCLRLLRAQVSAGTWDVQFRYGYIRMADADFIGGRIVSLDNASWNIVPMDLRAYPLRNLHAFPLSLQPEEMEISCAVQVWARRTSGAGTLDLDCILNVPTDEGCLYIDAMHLEGGGGITGYTYRACAPEDRVAVTSVTNAGGGLAYNALPAPGGSDFYLPPGDGRMIAVFARAATSVLADVIEFGLTAGGGLEVGHYYPRWLSLRGAE